MKLTNDQIKKITSGVSDIPVDPITPEDPPPSVQITIVNLKTGDTLRLPTDLAEKIADHISRSVALEVGTANPPPDAGTSYIIYT